jgi:thiol:disulfide interchange protein DsbA
MNRRQFTLQAIAAGATSLLAAAPALAQGAFAEGREYNLLKDPVPVPGGGKVEVIEFFGYWCPHCAAFEPTLEAWAHKLPSDVNFRRMPVAFSPTQESYQRLYFALEAMGPAALNAVHGKVFVAMHQNRQRLDKDAEITALAQANGVDGAKLLDAMKSFSVATKVAQARQAMQAYKIDGVPTVAVQGRFITSVGQAGTHERTVQVMDALIQRARKG